MQAIPGKDDTIKSIEGGQKKPKEKKQGVGSNVMR